ncbi:hypothetical protein NE235_19265 [Actinoallomurus spadix]|uniref:hypothetical protein n=1 Tax=Actinoallomurus spadix TaxID=79912 RepID=UPI002092571C|nr:hypothetical protein [Actinoallomurus spadix]MCO5988247.1 hypothetical protein [Actinoallomurus spadix]
MPLVLGGVFALVLGAALTWHTYGNSRQTIPNTHAYGPVMWRDEPADQLFPARIAGKENGTTDQQDPKITQWLRLGIAPNTSCANGLTGGLAGFAARQGCKAVVRATYVDPSGSAVATVAVIVLPSNDARMNVIEHMSEVKTADEPDLGVRAFAVPGTPASRWTDDARNGTSACQVFDEDIPYAVAVTAGATDGRRAARLPAPWGARLSTNSGREDRMAWAYPADDLAKAFGVYLADLARKGT